MKRLGWKVTGLIAAVLLLGSGIALDAHEESSYDTHQTSNEIPFKAQILKYGLKNLNYLKRALPDLYAEVLTPNWMELDGSDKLRLVVKSMANVWDTKEGAIDKYLSRIDQYVSIVPAEEREDVDMFFGMIGQDLLSHVFLIEQNKDFAQRLVEEYSIVWEDDDSGKLVEFEQCLDQSIVAMGTDTKETFDAWLDAIEEMATGTNMLKHHASLQLETTAKFAGVILESFKAELKCNPDWEADS